MFRTSLRPIWSDTELPQSVTVGISLVRQALPNLTCKPGDRFVLRPKQRPKTELRSPEDDVLPRERSSVSFHQLGSKQACLEPTRVPQEKEFQPRAVSVGRDFFVTGLWVIPAIGIFAYFVGAMATIAVASALVVALALCLNPTLGHTIELKGTHLPGGGGSHRHTGRKPEL